MHYHNFPIDDGFAWNGQRAGNLREALGPVQAVAGEHFLSSPVEMDLNAVAVVLDFMKPQVALRRLGLQRGKLGFNEPRHAAIRFDTKETHKSPPHRGGQRRHFTYFPEIPNNQGK